MVKKHMTGKFSTINIRTYLDKASPNYIGEEHLYKKLSEFSCPNPDVEYFLLHNAIEFTKKDQSVTHLLFNQTLGKIAGYYSIAIKPLTIRAKVLSKTMCKKLARVSILNKETDTYTTSAYLIAQLGKNFSIPQEQRISGDVLLNSALDTISNIKYEAGGIIAFLECEDRDILMDFYTRNQFLPFDIRTTAPNRDNKVYTLNQLLKLI